MLRRLICKLTNKRGHRQIICVKTADFQDLNVRHAHGCGFCGVTIFNRIDELDPEITALMITVQDELNKLRDSQVTKPSYLN